MHTIERFVSEVQTEFTTFINKMILKQLFISPTATGKTTLIINYADKHPFKKIVLLCPTRTLVDNILQSNPNLICGYGYEFISANRSAQFMVTTYDSIVNLTDIDLFFVDEGHLPSPHASFRDVIPELFKTQTKTVFMTATPEVIEDYFPTNSRDKYVFEVQLKKPRKLSVDILNMEYKAERLIEDIIYNRINDYKDVYKPSTILIRINSKKVIDRVMNTFRPYLNERIACIYSDEDNVLNCRQNEDTVSRLKKGVFKDVDVVLCTSVYDAGLSFDTDRDIECFAVSPHSETMPNPIDMVQLLARVRENSNKYLKLTIIGNFQGYELVREPLIKYNSKVQLCDVMNQRYMTYSKLYEFDYINVLGRYDVNVNLIESLDIKMYDIKKVSRKSMGWIASNFNSFPKKYEIIKSNLLCTDNPDIQLKLITAEGDIVKYTKGSAVAIERVFNILYDAVKHNIDFRLFIGNNFSNKRFELLKAVKESYDSNLVFKNLIDDLNPNSKNKVFNYDELGYNKLINKHHRNIIKSLYNLIYSKCDFREKSVTMKFIKDAPDNLLINFMKRFNAEEEEVSIALIEEKF
jgi:hypothetical protein